MSPDPLLEVMFREMSSDEVIVPTSALRLITSQGVFTVLWFKLVSLNQHDQSPVTLTLMCGSVTLPAKQELLVPSLGMHL